MIYNTHGPVHLFNYMSGHLFEFGPRNFIITGGHVLNEISANLHCAERLVNLMGNT